MPRVLLHIDMDAFYASIEQRDNPALRGKPVIVGAPPDRRGVVCAASYEARKFGVRSALPSMTAGRLCPNGIFVRPRMDVYRAESHRIMEILGEAGGVLERTSVDEAYLELTEILAPPTSTIAPGEEVIGSIPVGVPVSSISSVPPADPDALLQSAMPTARALKNRIREVTGLTCSIGVAPNKMLAKIGSDFKKPDGLTLIPETGKIEFLRTLPVAAIHGVGRVTNTALFNVGIETIAHLQDYTGNLRSLVGSWAPSLIRYAQGEDDRILDTGDEPKSISAEETFSKDTDDRTILRATLHEQSVDIADKLEKYHLAARTVQVKVRYSDFTTLTRQVSVPDNIESAKEIYRLGCYLLAHHRLVTKPLRLLGLGAGSLRLPSEEQLKLPLAS